jgi:mannosylglycerate hydrolase
MLESAWRYLLQNHQHDSICGTSDDKAFRYDMMRYEWIRQITDCVIRESMAAIANKINTTFAVASSYVVAMNTLAWNRDGFAREKISLPRDVSCFKLLDTSGKEIAYQVHDKKDGEVDVSFVALDVPAMGYKSYAIVKADKETLFDSDIAVGAHTLENRFLRVELDSKNGGRLTVFDRRTNKSWTGLGVLQDSGDAGDLYGCSPPDHDEVISSLSARAEIAVVERGPVRGVLRTKLTLSIPQQLTIDRNSRSETRVECQVATDVVLYSGIPIIELTIRYNNAAEDHRLRMVFPLGAHADSSFAESQFYIVERSTRLLKASGWQEKHPGTHPQLGWVDAGNGKSGLTIANRGSAEFEVSGEAESAIYLTLLRSVGFLFRPDTQYGPMKGGIPAPEAQCLGDHLFSYALIPHKSTWLESRAYKDAKNFNVPLLALNVDRHDGSLEPVMSFLRLEPDTLILSALKKAEDDGSAIVRFYNICDKETEATLDWFKSPSKIGSATIDEDMLDEAQPEDRKHGIPTRPYEVKTLKVLF